MWCGGITLFVGAYFIFGEEALFNPYLNNPTIKLYKGLPDYANGTVTFYEKEVKNAIRNL